MAEREEGEGMSDTPRTDAAEYQQTDSNPPEPLGMVDVEFARQLERELTESTAENTRLRAALASSKDPCLYCQLPKDEMVKCRSGFPGCARADDLMGCPELGAALEVERLEHELANARLDAARYKYLRALNKCEFASLIDDCLHQDLNFDTEVDRRRNQA